MFAPTAKTSGEVDWIKPAVVTQVRHEDKEGVVGIVCPRAL